MKAEIATIIPDISDKYDHIVFGEYHGFEQAEFYRNPALFDGMDKAGIDVLYWESIHQIYQDDLQDYIDGDLKREGLIEAIDRTFTAAKLTALDIAEEQNLSDEQTEALKQQINDTLKGYMVDTLDQAHNRDIKLIGLDPSTKENWDFVHRGQADAAMPYAIGLIREKAQEQGYNRPGLLIRAHKENDPIFAEQYDEPRSSVLYEHIRNTLFTKDELEHIDKLMSDAYIDVATQRDREFWEPVIQRTLPEGAKTVSIVGVSHVYEQKKDGIDEIMGGDHNVATIHLFANRADYEENLQKATDAGDPPHASIILDEGIFIPHEKLDIEGYEVGVPITITDLNTSGSLPDNSQTQESEQFSAPVDQIDMSLQKNGATFKM